MDKPWFNLDPNDFSTQWWRFSVIIDDDLAKNIKNENDTLCYFILQDCNMGGIFWRVSTWYNNDPNRYSQTMCQTEWNFSKPLIDMHKNDIVYLNTNADIKFKVNLCRFTRNHFDMSFCKILERVHN
jgi:hypothetical protein